MHLFLLLLSTCVVKSSMHLVWDVSIKSLTLSWVSMHFLDVFLCWPMKVSTHIFHFVHFLDLGFLCIFHFIHFLCTSIGVSRHCILGFYAYFILYSLYALSGTLTFFCTL
jgi:hypothetical protein